MRGIYVKIKWEDNSKKEVLGRVAQTHNTGLTHKQPHYRTIQVDAFQLIILTKVTLARSNSALPDDGDYTEICWGYFIVNFNVI